MMRTGIIYAYTNLESGRMYIGQTIDPERRFKQHLTDNYRQGWHIDYQNNPDKYEYSIIEMDVPEDKLNEREIYWISFFGTYNNGYNLNEGGGSQRGYKHTVETKNKISKANRGRISKYKGVTRPDFEGEKHPMYGKHHSEEVKRKISEANKGRFAGENNPFYGKHHSEETKQILSELAKYRKSNLGNRHTDEAKAKISKANKGKHWFNNGVINITAFECPEGFVKGRLKHK